MRRSLSLRPAGTLSPRRPSPIAALLLAALLAGGIPRAAEGTWSIVICDRRTREVGIASVTCLDNFDLLAITPVVRVGQGAGAVQAAGDFDGIRRPVIRTGLMNGTAPSAILTALAGLPGHSMRQYGIVDTLGRTTTFTGVSTGAWTGGGTGATGDWFYAVQGNVLAGPCVVPEIFAALQTSAGDLPTALMAAMQAARAEGGDGRCSCAPSTPTACGCPPASFVKSGHIGYFIIARIGDADDPACSASGCADGDYLYELNVAFQSASAPDPVEQLQTLFDARRAALAGHPDAIASTATLTEETGGRWLTISWLDHSGAPVTIPLTVTVAHETGSAMASEIGPVTDLGGGVFTVFLAEDVDSGLDRFRVTANDGVRPVVLMPSPSFCAGSVALGAPDCDSSGTPDLCDIASGAAVDVDGDGAPDGCPRFQRGDCNGDSVLNFPDPIVALAFLFGAPGDEIPCEEACNADGDQRFDLGDAVMLLSALFVTGPPFPPPGGDCGIDPAASPVGCALGTACP